MPHKLTPCIRCTDNAKEVAQYYVDIFPDAVITKENPVTVWFEIFGRHASNTFGGLSVGHGLKNI